MSLELCILASGSAGNAGVIRSAGGVMLIDAGIGPRTTARRLQGTGVDFQDLGAICLTHLDSDHYNGNWLATIIRRGIRVFCHVRCAPLLIQRGVPGDLLRPFDQEAFEPLPGLKFLPIALAHDIEGSHGFLIESQAGRIGYATDLGRVPEELIERFVDLQVLALESNYDPQMQLNSGRPFFLQQRIMGGRGHLSNGQALTAIQRILDQCEENHRPLPGHIVLLHRSRQCNCPDLLRRYFSQDARIAARLTLAHQGQRTEWLRPRQVAPGAGEQLSLSWQAVGEE